MDPIATADSIAATAAANWFLALVVPPQPGWEALMDDLPANLRRFAPEDRHLTVAFLGACGAERARAAWRALAPLPHPSIRASAGAWRALGPRRRPSAYGLTLGEGMDTAASLLAGWGDLARHAAGLPAEGRPPLPHITLARPPRRQVEALRGAMASWLVTAPVPAEPFLLERLALYTWRPERRERLFRIVAERRLDSPESGELTSASP
jgi:2'-5' RNA ligase